MPLNIQTNLENVDWERLAQVYALAFKGIQTAELIELVFIRSYATRIALLDGVIVGGVYAFSDGELDATIHGLCVHPDFQRQGIGRALMESIMQSFGPHIALLLTAEAMHQPLYCKLGFRPLKTAMGKGFPPADMED
ncbi:N-acetyltransferase [bacterium]|nr:MAG: N-acetyltransferase [bacterium]